MPDDEPRPRIPLHLHSQFSPIADLAAALFWAIDRSGPRLPSRRDIARAAGVSEATVSRRFRDRRSTQDALVSRVVRARGATYPPGWAEDGWGRWIPRTDAEMTDARVWLTCLALAAYSPAAAEAVHATWASERPRLPRGDGGEEEVLHALVLGLVVVRAVEPAVTHEHAVALLRRALDALVPPA